jgi:hypothetical protein
MLETTPISVINFFIQTTSIVILDVEMYSASIIEFIVVSYL